MFNKKLYQQEAADCIIPDKPKPRNTWKHHVT